MGVGFKSSARIFFSYFNGWKIVVRIDALLFFLHWLCMNCFLEIFHRTIFWSIWPTPYNFYNGSSLTTAVHLIYSVTCMV